jgi:hypothetical protein
MSTNLNDLPGPSEKIDNTEVFEDEEDFVQQNQQGNYQSEEYNVPLNKKESSPVDILDIISNETKYHGKENLLLLIILFISTLRYSDEYTRKIMTLLSFSVTNLTMISVIKALLLLILFIICKHYILPFVSF